MATFSKLFVDKIPHLPEEYSYQEWTMAHSFHEAITKLELLEFEVVSLCMDLSSWYGSCEMTGFEIIQWLGQRQDRNLYIPPFVTIHEKNPTYKAYMEHAINKFIAHKLFKGN